MGDVIRFPNRMRRPMIASWEEWLCVKMSLNRFVPLGLQLIFVRRLAILHRRRDYPQAHEYVRMPVYNSMDVFDGLNFPQRLPHAQGDIPCALLGKLPASGLAIIWAIGAERSYQPESHGHRHTLLIVEGTGKISVNGVEKFYAKGDIFNIEKNVPHGFVWTDTFTVVIESEN